MIATWRFAQHACNFGQILYKLYFDGKIKKVPRHRLAHIEFTVKQQKKHAKQAAAKTI